MMCTESRDLVLSNIWQHHVIPTRINHVLVCDAEGNGRSLAGVALQIAGPSLAEVTLCCRSPRPDEPGKNEHAGAALLRQSGLTVFVEPATASEIKGILLVDASRSVDLIIMRDHESIETADWHTAASIKVARRMERPVIACGPFSSQNHEAYSGSGPVLAAVSLRESSHQIVRAAGMMGQIVGGPVTILHAEDIAHGFSRPDNLAGLDCECQLLGNWLSIGHPSVSSKIVCGPIAETVTRFAAKANASLIAVGVDLEEEGREAQRSDTLRRHLLMSAPCPVLFVPTFHTKGKRKIEPLETSAKADESANNALTAKLG